MDKIVIEGGHKLSGVVEISGSKNAALPIMAASILTDDPVVIRRVPNLTDVHTLATIIGELGMEVRWPDRSTLAVKTKDNSLFTAPYERVREMRGSICVLGPLLAKRRKAVVAVPGGCVIGLRPIDLHLMGLKALGASIEVQHGNVVATADRLKGTEIFLAGPNGPTVTGTANVMCAATLAEGRTVIKEAACEPEVHDLAFLLNAMGAKISGIGTKQLVIDGVERLHGTEHDLIPDRIEAGTFLAAAAITGGSVVLQNMCWGHLDAVLDHMQRMNIRITKTADGCRVEPDGELAPLNFATAPYPGFPTDMQAQLMALLTIAKGTSVITEKVYPDRFMHVAELNRLGANIHTQGASAIVEGVERLSGAKVIASDLRASAALVVAGLVAKGTTEVKRVYHIDRGYERIEEKLRRLGARIERLHDPEESARAK
jgi:UDP-N-acetylglucosamine 1-carboxyvinyltransferase